MATVPVLDPTDAHSSGQDESNHQFQRLEHVRQRQRARRRHRAIVITMLVAGLAGAGAVGFTTGHRPDASPPAPAPPAITPAPPAAAAPVAGRPIASASTAPRMHDARREAASPAPPRAEGQRSGPPVLPREEQARDEPPDGDATAAIDWLLKTSRTGGQ
jgi:hypothetical protein